MLKNLSQLNSIFEKRHIPIPINILYNKIIKNKSFYRKEKKHTIQEEFFQLYDVEIRISKSSPKG